MAYVLNFSGYMLAPTSLTPTHLRPYNPTSQIAFRSETEPALKVGCGVSMGRVIFTRANLVDGERPAKSGSTVTVEGDRITAIGETGTMAPSREDRVIDLAGKTIMPGMFSCHFHAAYETVGANALPLGLDKPATYLALRAARNLNTALMCGFTGAVGASTAYDIDSSLKRALDDGLLEGPRFMPSSRDIITTGDSNDRSYWLRFSPEAEGAVLVCDGPDEFRKAVRSEIHRGAEIIKLYPTGGHGVRLPRDVMTLTKAELDSAVETAHERGAKVRGHIAGKNVIMECVDSGVDLIDHADRMDAECIDAFLRAGSFVLPSLLFPIAFLESAEARGEGHLPQWKAMRRDIEYTASMLPEANSAGVKLVVGDDFGTYATPHGDYAKELEVYVRWGSISPLEVITWATKNGAELMGLGDRLGTLETGKLADILVVDGDPTINIAVLQNTDNLLAIMKDGVFIKDHLL